MRLPSAVFAALAAMFLAQTSEAAPVTKEACRDAFEESQTQRASGALLEARSLLRVCASASCPSFIQVECLEWLTQVERAVPSVVLIVNTESGDLAGFAATMDGKPFTPELEGKPVEVDPGVHHFEFTLPGRPTIKRREVVLEGDKSRAIEVRWQAPVKQQVLPPPEPRVAMHRPIPPLVYAAAATAMVGAAGFATFGLLGRSKQGELDSCRPFCTGDQTGPVRSNYLLANISLGVSAAAVVVGAVLYLVRPEKPVGAGPKLIGVSGLQWTF